MFAVSSWAAIQANFPPRFTACSLSSRFLPVPVTPTEIHEIANRLWLGQPIPKKGEPCVRTIASRAYYAAYLSTREALRAAYSNPSYDVGHAPFANFMIMTRKPKLALAGNLLKALSEARERADYELGASLTHAEAETLVDDALEVIQLSSDLESDFGSHPYHAPARS